MQAALDAGEAGIMKGKLAGVVLKSTELTPAERAKSINIVTSAAFLEAGMEVDPARWLYDADTGMVIGVPE